LTTFGADGVSSAPSSIVGLSATDTLVDIDYFNSGNGQLYGMGASGTLYTLNIGGATTTATVDSGPAYTPAVAGGVTSVGTPLAIDFNPMADRLRVFSGVNNFRITQGTGLLSNDGPLTYVAGDPQAGQTPNLVAAAYVNNFDGPPSTTLYSIDASSNSLVVHSVGPQFSTITTQDELQVGGAGAAIDFLAGNTGFDVLTLGGINTAYVSSANSIYTVNLNAGGVGDPAGDLTLFATVTGAGSVGGITDIAAIPEPASLILASLGLGGIALVCVRRRQKREHSRSRC
jgi:Domain of unknown function (DUF4394)/PEP-CTERM motif